MWWADPVKSIPNQNGPFESKKRRKESRIICLFIEIFQYLLELWGVITLSSIWKMKTFPSKYLSGNFYSHSKLFKSANAFSKEIKLCGLERNWDSCLHYSPHYRQQPFLPFFFLCNSATHQKTFCFCIFLSYFMKALVIYSSDSGRVLHAELSYSFVCEIKLIQFPTEFKWFELDNCWHAEEVQKPRPGGNQVLIIPIKNITKIPALWRAELAPVMTTVQSTQCTGKQGWMFKTMSLDGLWDSGVYFSPYVSTKI